MIIHEQFSRGRRQSEQKTSREWVPFHQIIGGAISESQAEVIYLRPEFEAQVSGAQPRKRSLYLKLDATKAVLWIMTIFGMGLCSGLLFELMNVF